MENVKNQGQPGRQEREQDWKNRDIPAWFGGWLADRKKEYLGDSVYAEFDGWGIVITTENGAGPSNTIYLEPEVIDALNRFQQRFNLIGLQIPKG